MKIKVEITEGKTKSNLVIEDGDLLKAKQKIEQFLDYALQNQEAEPETSFQPEFVPQWMGEYDIQSLSQKEKLHILLEREHKGEWVKSQDMKEEYEAVWGDEIKLSSVSTYLSRFHSEGRMERKGSRAQREYRFFEGVKV